MSHGQPQESEADPVESWDQGELVAADDRVIGRVFWVSLVILAAVILAVLAGWWVRTQRVHTAPTAPPAPPVLAPVATGATDVKVPFTDITRAAGIDFVHVTGAYGEKLMPETMGGGVAFLDHDGDGDQDLLFVNSTTWPDHREPSSVANPTRLYANDGQGGFTDVSAATGLDIEFYGMGMAAGDTDGDGDVDLFLTGLGRCLLLINEGGTFRDATAAAGVGGDPADWATSAGFFDADGDGDLDLFVCRYLQWSREIDLAVDFRLTGIGRAFGPPMTFSGAHPLFYENLGDGRFRECAEAAGLHVTNAATGVPVAKALGVTFVDVDRDGLLDILVANDTTANFCFINRGGLRFAECATLFGLAFDKSGAATGAMGIDAGFYLANESLAIAIGNFANEPTSFYASGNDPTLFVDVAMGEGIGAPSREALSFGLVFVDADLDGGLDLIQANGHVEDEIAKVQASTSHAQPAQLFRHRRATNSPTYEVLPEQAIGDLARPIVGRGLAYADIDGDGDLDLAIAANGGAARLLRNDLESGAHWLRVTVRDRAPNTGAIGATVFCQAGGQTQRRLVMPTRSYLAQVELPVTFGLGTATTVERLAVRFPDGEERVIPVEAVDRMIEVRR